MKSILLLCVFIASVLGHAVLINPVPLNPNPTTAQPCGVASYPANPVAAAQWNVGDTITITWKKVASDGGNTVSGTLSPNADPTAFTTSLFTGLDTSQGQITYTKSFTIAPGTTCTSASGLCLVRISSENNWNSCTYVNITNCADCPPPPPAPPSCKKAAGLTFCSFLNGQDVYVDADQAVTAIDTTTRNTFWQNINSTIVFNNRNSTECRQDYVRFLCSINMPPCPGTDATAEQKQNGGISFDSCTATCKDVMTTCGLTDIHEQLYTCANYGNCPEKKQVSSASTLALSLFSVGAVALAVL